MELFFVTVIAAILGTLVRYLVRGRRTYGAVLLPAIDVAVTAVVWVVLLWLGFSFDGGWIWVISLVAGLLAALVTAIVLPVRRQAHDEERYTTLAGAR